MSAACADASGFVVSCDVSATGIVAEPGFACAHILDDADKDMEGVDLEAVDVDKKS